MVLVVSCTAIQALTIVSGPTITPASNAPLAAVLALATDTQSRVSVSVGDGSNTWRRDFFDYGTAHSLPLLGFQPNRTNVITVTVYDTARNTATISPPLTFITDPLPADFPTSVVLTSRPDKMEPGYTLFRIQNRTDFQAYITIVDNSGAVVWYSSVPTTADVRQLPNGHLFIPLTSQFVEIDMLGNTVNTWSAPPDLLINIHDGVPTANGTILYLSDASEMVPNFPTSATDPNAPLQTASVLYNKVVEISATNAALLNTWSPINVLDPRRLTYLTFEINSSLGWDIEHSNAVVDDTRDGSIIVSMREQNAVIKFSRATGQLKWILGPHENWGLAFQPYLLTPVGTPFAWNYAQHAPMITPSGSLLLYDDGNYRAMPFDPPVPDTNNYSRAVEYQIDETNMTVSQVWEYNNLGSDRLYTPIIGDADWLTNSGNVLVTFGYVTYVNGLLPNPWAPNATMVRIKEVTHDPIPEVVFDLAFFDSNTTDPNYKGYFCYRSDRVSDLYPHLPQPVVDLSIQYQAGVPFLTFSADPVRSYMVQASEDLVQWADLGPASLDETGYFVFADSAATDFGARYYRVETQ